MVARQIDASPIAGVGNQIVATESDGVGQSSAPKACMIDSLFNLLFRCRHRRLTRPITPINAGGVPQGSPYVVCLDCGKRFEYDPENMRIGRAIQPEPPVSGPG